MAKTIINVIDVVDGINAKVDEIRTSLAEMKDKVSVNTFRTQSYQKGRDIKQLEVIKELLTIIGDKAEVSITTRDVLESLTTLTSERKARYTVEVNEGDNVLELLEKYKDVKDIYSKIKKAAEEKGLKIAGTSVVKA